MDEFLKTLQQKEKELRLELERTPIFKQWESVKNTIGIFQNGTTKKEQEVPAEPIEPITQIPKFYDDAKLTWREKVLYALSKMIMASVSDIVAFLKKAGAKESDEFLTKRIGVTVSRLKMEGDLVGVQMDGKRGMYFLK